jgi:hypothetical protein
LPFGGILASKISADVSLADISLTYTFRPTILGAHYTVSLSIPYVWVDIEAKVSLNPRLFPSIIGNRTKTVSDGTMASFPNENWIEKSSHRQKGLINTRTPPPP